MEGNEAMKLFLLIVLASLSAFGQISFSTAIEPALNAPARFGISAAVAGNITPNNALSVRFGSGSTLLGGYARTLVCFAGCGFWGEGASLYLDAQAGMTYRLAADQKELTRIVMYGAGVRTYLGGGFSASYGLHVNKIAHVPMYPSVYVSIGWGTN